jgi:hypothetical protein
MTNHYSGPGSAEEIHRLSHVLTGMSADEVTTEQHQRNDDAAELDFPYRKISDRAFARRVSVADSDRAIAEDLMPRTEESLGQKIFLPWRSNGPRFAPRQYYYAASKSGVMPSRAISATVPPRIKRTQGQ